MAESVDESHAAGERRPVLLQLYTAERAEQQTAIQQTLATVAAAVAYGVFVGDKLLRQIATGAADATASRM